VRFTRTIGFQGVTLSLSRYLLLTNRNEGRNKIIVIFFSHSQSNWVCGNKVPHCIRLFLRLLRLHLLSETCRSLIFNFVESPPRTPENCVLIPFFESLFLASLLVFLACPTWSWRQEHRHRSVYSQTRYVLRHPWNTRRTGRVTTHWRLQKVLFSRRSRFVSGVHTFLWWLRERHTQSQGMLVIRIDITWGPRRVKWLWSWDWWAVFLLDWFLNGH
jgi:hypothetical protein